MDGEEICKGNYKNYKAKKVYNENSIGCKVFLNEIKEERTKNHFRGEMSALHFVAVNSHTLILTHKLLQKILRVISMHELFPFIAFGKNRCDNWPQLQQRITFEELIESTLLERVFLIINPKYASKFFHFHEKIYVYERPTGTIELFNHAENVFKNAKIHHNYPARDVLLNIGGSSCLLPFLYELAELNVQSPIMLSFQ